LFSFECSDFFFSFFGTSGEEVLPGLIPTFAAILTAAVIILISNSFSEPYQKIIFQFMIFGVGFAVSLALIISLEDHSKLIATFKLFSGLSFYERYLITIATIGAVYFGAGMYIAAPERTKEGEVEEELEVDTFRTPASADNIVGFTIPENVNTNDKEFFETMLDR
jgi:hypothetical protein